MKKCTLCDRRGMLLRLDARGLCGTCAARLDERRDQRVAKVRRALAAADAMRNVDWAVEELGRAETRCRELERMERSALGRVSARTETLARAVVERRDRFLTRWAGTVVETTTRRLARLDSPARREALVREALARLQEHAGRLRDGAAYREHQRALSSLLVRYGAGEEGPASARAPEAVAEAPRPEPEAPHPAPPANRRRARRVRRRFPVVVAPGEDRCLAENVSSTGILLRSAQEHPVGDFLDLWLHTARGRFRATGVVVRADRGAEPQGLPNALGVAFTGGAPVAA